MSSHVIALVGAESTGKTTMCQALAGQLQAQGHSVGVVPEYLRQWCEARGRTPRPASLATLWPCSTSR